MNRQSVKVQFPGSPIRASFLFLNYYHQFINTEHFKWDILGVGNKNQTHDLLVVEQTTAHKC